jgi:arginine:ornithine antiporter/lysine permease
MYSLWLIYAAGLNYLLMALIFMAVGIPVYVYARHQSNPDESAFSSGERFAAGILIVFALFGLYAMCRGLV